MYQDERCSAFTICVPDWASSCTTEDLNIELRIRSEDWTHPFPKNELYLQLIFFLFTGSFSCCGITSTLAVLTVQGGLIRRVTAMLSAVSILSSSSSGDSWNVCCDPLSVIPNCAWSTASTQGSQYQLWTRPSCIATHCVAATRRGWLIKHLFMYFIT